MICTRYQAAFLLVVFSGYYVTKLPVSPVYVFTLAGTCVIICASLLGRCRWQVTSGLAILSITLAWLTTSQLYLGAPINNVVNCALGPALALLLEATRGHTREETAGLAFWFVLASLLLCTGEAAYRLTHPSLEFLQEALVTRGEVDDIALNAFKYSSFMYPDSNYVGLQLALLLALQVELFGESIKLRRLLMAWTVLLVVASLSRASMLAAAAVWGWFKMRQRPWARLAVPVIGAAAVIVGLPVLSQDISFGSKFDILRAFQQYAHQADSIPLLLGVGAGRAEEVLGVGAHNIVVTYVVELGLVSTLLLCVLWIVLVRQAKGGAFLVLALLVNGFSFTTLAAPFLYGSLFLVGGPWSRSSPKGRPQPDEHPGLREEEGSVSRRQCETFAS
jgi:hypothetical protein